MENQARYYAFDLLFSLLIVIGVTGLFASQLNFGGLELLNTTWSLGALALAGGVWFVRRGKVALYPELFIGGLVLLLAGGFIQRPWVFFAEATERSVMTLGAACLIALIVIPSALRLRAVTLLLTPVALMLVQAYVAWGFLSAADFRPLFNDDHPSFLYRLQILWQHFPEIRFYNPRWNAGYITTELYLTGVLNVFLVSLPLLAFGPTITSLDGIWIYSIVVAYVFIGLVPWSIYSATRILGFSKQAGVIAGFFALGPSLKFLGWVLHYGTIGFAFSAALVPLVFALSWQLLTAPTPSWRAALTLVLCGSLCLMWPLMFVVFVPLVVFAVGAWQRLLTLERALKLSWVILCLLLLNSRWLFLAAREPRVSALLKTAVLPGTSEKAAVFSTETLGDALRLLHETFVQINPVVVLMFFAALPLVDKKLLRTVGATIGWLVVLAFVGKILKPQLETHRLVEPGVFLLLPFAARAVEFLVGRIIHGLSPAAGLRGWGFAALGAATLFAFTFVSLPTVGAIYRNRSEQGFKFATSVVRELAQVLEAHGGGGRTAVLGFVLHEWGADDRRRINGGHVAPLAVLSGKSLYASHFYHARWEGVDPIPRSYRERGEEGVEEFLDLINATAVVTFQRNWSRYCRKRPQIYEQIYSAQGARLYKRRAKNPSFFFDGQGEIDETGSGIDVVPYSEQVILKYRYYPDLRATGGAKLAGHYVFSEALGGGIEAPFEFIKLTVPKELVGTIVHIDLAG